MSSPRGQRTPALLSKSLASNPPFAKPKRSSLAAASFSAFDNQEDRADGESHYGRQFAGNAVFHTGVDGPEQQREQSAVEEVMALKARTAYWNDLSAPNSPLLKYFRQLIFRQERSRLGAKVAVTKLVPKPYVNVIGKPADFAQGRIEYTECLPRTFH